MLQDVRTSRFASTTFCFSATRENAAGSWRRPVCRTPVAWHSTCTASRWSPDFRRKIVRTTLSPQTGGGRGKSRCLRPNMRGRCLANNALTSLFLRCLRTVTACRLIRMQAVGFRRPLDVIRNRRLVILTSSPTMTLLSQFCWRRMTRIMTLHHRNGLPNSVDTTASRYA